MSGHCPYCDASLLAVSRDRVLRYVIRPEAAAPPPDEAGGEAQLQLLPFWHLGGLLYAWQVGSKVELIKDTQRASSKADSRADEQGPEVIRKDSGPQKHWSGRVLEMTLPDPATSALGITSLRTRGQVFPVEPFTEEHETLGEVVPSALDHRAAKDRLFARAIHMSAAAQGLTRVDCQRYDFVSETLSLVYYPFWVRARQGGYDIWDGVNGDPEPLSSPVALEGSSGSAIFDQLKIVELNCISCGTALPAGNHSAVLPCRGCGKFWGVTGDGLEPFEAHWARPQMQGQNLVWLPFWRVPAEVSYSGRKATRHADLTAVLGALKPRSELLSTPPDAPLCYFAPAYGAMHAPRIDHAARDMTRYQPVLEVGQPSAGEVYNCFFSADDASRMAYATWIMVITAVVVPKLRSIRVQSGAPALWYVPFESTGRELVNLLTGFAYDRIAFRGVRH
jgi:hypothetical protein